MGVGDSEDLVVELTESQPGGVYVTFRLDTYNVFVSNPLYISEGSTMGIAIVEGMFEGPDTIEASVDGSNWVSVDVVVHDPDDYDGDGVLNGVDLCWEGETGWISDPTTDHDGDGCRDDGEDLDDDNDAIPDVDDDCPRGSVGWTSSPSTDIDGDGCRDLDEEPDTDLDGLIDCYEEWLHGTDWFDMDTDNDGYDDGVEVDLGLDPLDADMDDDGMSDFYEDQFAITDATLTDTDGDGLQDGCEIGWLSSAAPGVSGVLMIPFGGTHPGVFTPDTDPATTTEPLEPDTDIDGLDDGEEDADHDGAVDVGETDPNDPDSDDDTFNDGDEVAAGSDPLDPDVTPENVDDPSIASITDVGNDQGRRVRLLWDRSRLDDAGSPDPILSYSLYRRIDGAKAAAPGDPSVAHHARLSGDWDFVSNQPATAEAQYSTLGETLCDSTEAGVCWSVFFVRAHTAAPAVFHDSEPDSGYSVDNLPPSVPEGFLAAYGAGVDLSWEPSAEVDFRYFKIYRGDEPDFTVDPESPLHTTIDTAWLDGGGDRDHFYRISAVDFAGNESPAVAPAATTGAGEATRPFKLHAAAPNPFNPRTTLSFDLHAAVRADLRVYDISGRVIRTLVAGQLPAGRHEVEWDGTDSSGRQIPAGIYFYKLEAGGRGATGRVALVK